MHHQHSISKIYTIKEVCNKNREIHLSHKQKKTCGVNIKSIQQPDCAKPRLLSNSAAVQSFSLFILTENYASDA